MVDYELGSEWKSDCQESKGKRQIRLVTVSLGEKRPGTTLDEGSPEAVDKRKKETMLGLSKHPR